MDEKLKVYKYQDGIEIAGNRKGLRHLAEICLALSNLAGPRGRFGEADYSGETQSPQRESHTEKID